MEPRRSGTSVRQPAADPTQGRAKAADTGHGALFPGEVRTPPMREVVKGWWTNSERLVSAAELEKADREQSCRDRN